MDPTESEEYLACIFTNKNEFSFVELTAGMINGGIMSWSFLKRYSSKTGNALDIGTFDGLFCHVLAGIGYDAFGMEPQENAVAFARSKGAKVHAGSFPDMIPPELFAKRYSLISILETIYYFHDLKKCLNVVNELLDDDGLLLIKCHQGFSRYYDDREHSFFSRYGDNVQGIPTLPSLRNILDRTGFRIVKVIGSDSLDTMPFRKCVSGLGPITSRILAVYNKFWLNGLSMGIGRSDRLIVLAGKRKDR